MGRDGVTMTMYTLPPKAVLRTLRGIDMASAASSPEQLVILDRVTWETYERLITEHGERCGTRFTYDEGVLQIMVSFFPSRNS